MNRSRIILIHGWGGSPQSDWIPWLTSKLELQGYEVITPLMPDTDNPQITPWVERLVEVVGTPKPTDVFIGHSIGCQTVLRYLEKARVKVDKVILVAPWFTLTNLEDDEARAIADPWVKTPIDFSKIKSNYQSMTTIFSDNDPWVPYQENVQLFRNNFDPKIITLHNKGHITGDEGSTQLSELLSLI